LKVLQSNVRGIKQCAISELKCLEELRCTRSMIYDFSHLSTLKILDVRDTYINQKQINNLCDLEELNCAYSEDKHIDISHMPKLKKFNNIKIR